MAQESPADTAGPSSPPPRLPEGWLPQWEGVQRQWYYVQRATGKSQWEIPTEPVVLTPSTTPTSIGTGPTQAPPSRPSTNSPQVTATGKSLVEHMESTADSARISSSLSSQPHEQPSNAMPGPVDPFGWHSLQSIRHGSQRYSKPSVPSQGGYAADQFHQTASENANPEPIKQGQHPTQPYQHANWDSHIQMAQPHSSVPTSNHIGEQYGKFALESQGQPQISAYISSMAYAGQRNPGMTNPAFSSPHPRQPQWQLEARSTKSSNMSQPPSDHDSMSSLSRPFFGSNPFFQPSEQHTGEPTSRPSQSSTSSHLASSYSGNHEETPQSRSSLAAYSYADKTQVTSLAGHPLSRSPSQQNWGFPHDQRKDLAGSHAEPSLYDYGPHLSNGHNLYQNSCMSQMPPDSGFNSSRLPATQGTLGSAQHYQNPIIQAGVLHYLPPQPQSGTQNDAISQHGTQYHSQSRQLPLNQSPWVTSANGSRIAASDPKFVSGPWASLSPPTTGPP